MCITVGRSTTFRVSGMKAQLTETDSIPVFTVVDAMKSAGMVVDLVSLLQCKLHF